MPRRRLGFTLVELLVVIGIISVLIAILLPTLAGARRSAATVKCAAHLRDLGNAIQMYANENGQYVPTVQSRYDSKFQPMWYDQLARYVFKSGVASPSIKSPVVSVINDVNFARTAFAGCPTFEFQRYENNPIRTSTGYGINLIPVPVTPPLTQSTNQFTGSKLPAPSASMRHYKFVEFKNPANRALMADANGYGGIQALPTDPINVYTKPPGNNVAGDIDYYRHGRQFDLTKPGCNVLFADLHVETCTAWDAFWAVRNPIKRANGSR